MAERGSPKLHRRSAGGFVARRSIVGARVDANNEDVELAGEPVRFHFQNFARAFLYELLPAVFLAPLAALVLENDPASAYNVMCHRVMWPSPRHVGWSSTVVFVLIQWPIQLAISWLVLYRVIGENELGGVDYWEVVLAFSWMVARYVVVAIKYAYFPEEEIEAMTYPPPVWDIQKSTSRLFAVSWSQPSVELLDTLIEQAMRDTCVHLRDLWVDISPETAAAIGRHLVEYETDADSYTKVEMAGVELNGVQHALQNDEHQSLGPQPKPHKQDKNSHGQSAVDKRVHQKRKQMEKKRVQRSKGNTAAFLSKRTMTTNSSSASLSELGSKDMDTDDTEEVSRFAQFGSSIELEDIYTGEFSQRHETPSSANAGQYVRTAEGTMKRAASTLSAYALLRAVVLSAFTTASPWFEKVTRRALPIAIALAPGLCRVFLGQDMYGSTLAEKFAYAACFSSTLYGSFSTLSFIVVCWVDMNRRKRMVEMLSSMVQAPGLPYHELFPFVDERKEPGDVLMDLRSGRNVFVWHAMRTVARKFAEGLFRRALAYIGVMILFAILATIMLNIVLWTSSRHHLATVISIGITIVIISANSLHALLEARTLQECVPDQRLILKTQIVGIDEDVLDIQLQCAQLAEGQLAGEDTDAASEKAASRAHAWQRKMQQSIGRLTSLKAVFKGIDSIIGFYEDELDPISVLGTPANSGLLSGTLGVVVTGLFLALDAYSNALEDGTYDEDGWYAVL